MTPEDDVLDPYVPERGNPGYEVTGYDLDLDYTVTTNHLSGRARITAQATEDIDRFSLDLTGLRATKVALDVGIARWHQRGAKLHIRPTGVIPRDTTFAVDVRYSGTPRPTRSTWGPVGWEELTDGILVAAQPSGASTWFPCNDLARQKAPFRVAVTAASSYHVVANGALLERRPSGSQTRWVYEQLEPTSPYLVTLHLGRYSDHVVATDPVPIRAVLPPENRPAFDAAFARQADMMRVFVDRFGPYPFASGYTVVLTGDVLEVPLEAQGQSIFGTNHLDGTHERLIAHELAHQWFGNSLTAARWQDIWLHEGFACYAEWLWSEGSGGPSAAALAAEHHALLRALPQDLVLRDPGPGDMFDDRVYKRGALTLHTLRTEMGDDAFFALLRRWTSTYEHGVVTTDDFVAMAEHVAGRSLGPLFEAWLVTPALPSLDAAS